MTRAVDVGLHGLRGVSFAQNACNFQHIGRPSPLADMVVGRPPAIFGEEAEGHHPREVGVRPGDFGVGIDQKHRT